MERDFLGMNEKEENSSSRQDSAFVGTSAVNWPFSNKIANLQHLMSFKTVHDEKSQKTTFDHFSSSGFQPVANKISFESAHGASQAKDAAQRCFNIVMRGANQFSTHAYRPQSSETFHGVSHQSVPVSMSSSPFFKIHGSSCGANQPVTTLKQQPPFVGFSTNNTNFVPRNVSKPAASSQLTIFYGGKVNVFDDVPLDEAHAIMLLASKACNANSTPNASYQRSEATVSTAIPKVVRANNSVINQTQVQTQMKNTAHVSILPLSITSHIVAHSRCSSSNTNEAVGVKSVGLLPPVVSQPSNAATTAAPQLLRAVPQARKASLARFLEKRKERVTSALPYSLEKKSSETTIIFEGGGNFSSKCLSADLSLSSNHEDSLCSVHPIKPPSTELEM